MRLLIDETYPASVAQQLRRRGHDVIAVSERVELRSLGDAALFDVAQRERRTIATENIADFVLLADAADERGQLHHGLVLIHPEKFPRGRQRTVGRLVTALEGVLGIYPEAKPRALRHWL